jgi:hypothetical protein
LLIDPSVKLYVYIGFDSNMHISKDIFDKHTSASPYMQIQLIKLLKWKMITRTGFPDLPFVS